MCLSHNKFNCTR
ncbi:hypothetical protein Pint_11063 [Pistacia integerrima]|uniref:Uncharacterized protein n=2 Tax=Pistacia TaxID=55512 RepID=A0ACC1A331_9ROSI|nr:hypothetical protein Pint_11063 [Pistacia integerrima]KAJ0080768.1 hypothetical protein Patl1_11212 [Pistacia atlantica]